MEVPSPSDGYVKRILAEDIGIACMTLGGGRETKESEIDLSVGILLKEKIGAKVQKGDTLAVIYGNDKEKMDKVYEMIQNAYEFDDNEVGIPCVIKERISPEQ